MTATAGAPADRSDHEQFLQTLAYLGVVGVPTVGLVTPPDPYSMAVGTGAMAVAAVAVGAWLAYGDGWERLDPDLPAPPGYLLSVVAAFGAGTLAGRSVPRSGTVTLAGFSVSVRSAVTIAVAGSALYWLFFLGGYRRLATVLGRGRTRTSG